MIVSLSPNEFDIFAALRAYLLAVLPNGIEVVKAQYNRVPTPVGPNYVLMTPLRKPRLATNIHGYADCYFQGSINGNTLTVTDIAFGTILANATVFGPNIAPGTVVTGTVGGIYTVSPVQVVSLQGMAAGTKTLTQNTEVIIQLDCHGPSGEDNAAIITTTFRDEYGVQLFGGPSSNIQPLYSDDPREVPFTNDQDQYEYRWVIEMHLQANQTVVVPQDYASALSINTIEADITPQALSQG